MPAQARVVLNRSLLTTELNWHGWSSLRGGHLKEKRKGIFGHATNAEFPE